MRRSLALSAILSLFVTASAFAIGEARMTGKIVDAATKKPIPDAMVHVEAVEGKTVKHDFKAKKDGSYTVFLLDGTLRYKVTYSAPGYVPFEDTMKLKLGEPNLRDIELQSEIAAASVNVPMEAKGDPAVEAYNDGAALANNGDYPGAIAKFEEAVAAKPDLTAAWMALAKISAKASQWPKAIDAAKKALEVDDEDTDMWTVLYQAYTASGDKANALIAEKKLPANATALFNQAARLINSGKDAEAETVLKQAVAVDEQYGTAWYELGMVYVRTGKNADARAAFNKYLELEPNGKDAATAKEMLSYIK